MSPNRGTLDSSSPAIGGVLYLWDLAARNDTQNKSKRAIEQALSEVFFLNYHVHDRDGTVVFSLLFLIPLSADAKSLGNYDTPLEYVI